VVRFQNKNVTANVSDAGHALPILRSESPLPDHVSVPVAVSKAAGDLGAAPVQYYRGPLASGAEVGVMQMMTGGCPNSQFLGDSVKSAQLFGACMGRFHSVDPAVMANFETSMMIKPDTGAILKQELGMSDDELSRIESVCGTMPGRFSQMFFLRQQGASPVFLQRIGSAIKRTCLGACDWLTHPMTKRMVTGHADVNHNNLMWRDPDYMVAIDFESARMMPAAFDLGAMLLAAERTGISAFAVPLSHRQALAYAYESTSSGADNDSEAASIDDVALDDNLEDFLWDMVITCNYTVIIP